MKQRKNYCLKMAGLNRILPFVEIEKGKIGIYSFVMLGDTELNVCCARELIKKFPENSNFDFLVVPEVKAVPLAQAICQQDGEKKFKDYIVLRKSIKPYMESSEIEEVKSVTTPQKQIMVMDKRDALKIKNKRLYLIDDVVSIGNSYRAMLNLVQKANANILFAGAVLREGNFNISDLERKLNFPITFLGSIPITKK